MDLSHQESSHLEGVVSALAEMEKEIDVIKANAEDIKRAIVALAREEAENAKNRIIASANEMMKTELDQATKDAGEKSKEILQKCEAEVKKLQIKINSSFDKAVAIVVKSVLGE